MQINVLGVSGSPRKEATHTLVQAALLGARSVADTSTGYVSLAGKVISPCDGCEECLRVGRCVIDDDMQDLYGLLLSADAIIIGSPVYFGGPSALCKAFLERVEAFGIREKRLRLKIGGAIASGGSRNGGQETTMLALNLWFHVNEMLPVGITAPVAQWGATGNAGHDPEDIWNDRFTLTTSRRVVRSVDAAWMYGRKIATVTQIVSAGRSALGIDLPDGPYGWELPEFPEALDALREGRNEGTA